MNILFVMIPLSLLLVAGGCWAFFWAVDAGQFDDLDSPGWDALEDSDASAIPSSERAPPFSRMRGSIPIQVGARVREHDGMNTRTS